jgi:hypothetical protein
MMTGMWLVRHRESTDGPEPRFGIFSSVAEVAVFPDTNGNIAVVNGYSSSFDFVTQVEPRPGVNEAIIRFKLAQEKFKEIIPDFIKASSQQGITVG